MRVAKRICAFALALTIAFLSVGYEPPKANASLLASVGWSCAVSAYLNGIGLTMDAACDSAEDIAYDVREWHENTIMPIWEKYEKAIDMTFDYATLIANGVNMSMTKQVRFSSELCNILGGFAAWLVSEFSLDSAEAPVTVYEVPDFIQFSDGAVLALCTEDVMGTVVRTGSDNLLYNRYFSTPKKAWEGYCVHMVDPETGATVLSTNQYLDYWNTGGYFGVGISVSTSGEERVKVFNYNADGLYVFSQADTSSSFSGVFGDENLKVYKENGVVTVVPAEGYLGVPALPEDKDAVMTLPAESDISTWEDFCTYVAQRDLEGVYTPEAVTVEDAQTGATDGEDAEEDTVTLIGTTNGILDWTKKIWQSIKDIPKNIADMLTDAFVLSDEYAEALPQILIDTFAERTGFLTYPMSLLFGFVDLIATPAGDFILEWDDVYEPFSRGKLISAGQFNVTQYVNSNEALSNVYSLWKTVVSGYLIFMFFDLCYKKYNAIVRDRLG